MSDALLPTGFYWVDRGNGPEPAKLARIEGGSIVNGLPVVEEVIDTWAYCGQPHATDKPPAKIICRATPPAA